jgi:predicted acyl esterase
MNKFGKRIAAAICCAGVVFSTYFGLAQTPLRDATLAAHRNAIESELESVAVIERKVMVTMRDGKRMQADIYRPKDNSKKYPIIFVRTPYNFNYWDVDLGAPRDLSTELSAVKHGYAYVEINERGRYFSEGDYDILGTPLTDSDDELRAVVERQGRTDRLLLDGGVADQCCIEGQ